MITAKAKKNGPEAKTKKKTRKSTYPKVSAGTKRPKPLNPINRN